MRLSGSLALWTVARNVSYYGAFVALAWFVLSSSDAFLAAIALLITSLFLVIVHEAVHIALLRSYRRPVKFVLIGDFFLNLLGEEFGIGFQLPQEMKVKERRLHAVAPFLTVLAASTGLLLVFAPLVLVPMLLLAFALSAGDLANLRTPDKGAGQLDSG